MHLRLSTNFSFRRFDLVLGPSLHRLPPQQPHLLHDPLLDRIGLLEVSLAVLYRPNYRHESISKTRVRLETGQNRLIAKFRGRHLLKSHPFPNPNLTPHHFESHPTGERRLRPINARIPKPTEADEQAVRIEKARDDVAFWEGIRDGSSAEAKRLTRGERAAGDDGRSAREMAARVRPRRRGCG